MEETKSDDINWGIVEEQMAINKNKRLNWKSIIGKTLTKTVAELKAGGHTNNQIYNYIITKYDLNYEMRRRLIIGIAARCGEINSEENAKMQGLAICPYCKGRGLLR